MGTKKKNRGNKLARMSEEERIRYLQHRAAIEEEAKRRKEQLISLFLKNKLKREQVFSRLNTAKINQQWRQILRQIKCQELKEEIEDFKKWFEYTLNKKNASIKMVLADLHEAENQYTKMHWVQMETFDKLTHIHSQCVGDYNRQYTSEKNEMYTKAVAEVSDINESYKEDIEQLQAAIYRMEEAFERTVSMLIARHTSEMDETRNTMLSELENLRNSRERQIEDIWRKIETVLKDYWEQTEDRRRQYLIMKEADYYNCKQIFENNQQINAVIESIKYLKDLYSKVQIDRERQIESRKCDREKIRKVFHDLKVEMVEKIKQDKKNLYFMNQLACETTDDLREILANGFQILKLYGFCRNLENQNEQFALESSSESRLSEKENEIKDLNEESSEQVFHEGSIEIVELDKFWKRYNEVFLENKALIFHCRELGNQTKYLKSILKSYFSDVMVKRPESKISYANGVQFYPQKPSKLASLRKKNQLQKWSLTRSSEDTFIENQMLSITIKKPLRAQTKQTAITGK